MATGSNIEWTQGEDGAKGATWNPVSGCTRASAGCDNCYAVTMTHRLAAMGQSKYAGLTVLNPRGDRHFNGVVRCHEDALKIPLHWKAPRRIFVNSMSDLFHKDVPFEFIDKVFAVMALTPQHTYQVLTKRPDRMAEYLNTHVRQKKRGYWHGEIGYLGDVLAGDGDGNGTRPECEAWFTPAWDAMRRFYYPDSVPAKNLGESSLACPWPLPNVWLGTSVENQQAADERIPHLLRCPAAVRFLSCEPLLGPVDLRNIPFGEFQHRILDSLTAGNKSATPWHLNWVIAGGESGPGARPCNVEWIRSIVKQCKAAELPCFVKQLGAKPCMPREGGQSKFHSFTHWCNKASSWIGGMGCTCFDAKGRHCQIGKHFKEAEENNAFPITICDPMDLKDTKGGKPAEWPEDLRVREFPKASVPA